MRLLLFILISVWPTVIQAQRGGCGPSIAVLMQLQGLYKESLVFTLQSTDKRQMRIWLNEVTGTWTLTMTMGDVTCIGSYGRGFVPKDRGM